jgi:hypothetical protein
MEQHRSQFPHQFNITFHGARSKAEADTAKDKGGADVAKDEVARTVEHIPWYNTAATGVPPVVSQQVQ